MSVTTSEMAVRQFGTLFRRMLSTGRPVAAEEAAREVETPEGFERRAFGSVVASLQRDGEIRQAGFRVSNTASHHQAIKRLWVLASEEGGAAQ